MRTGKLIIIAPCILDARLQAVQKSDPHWGIPFSELLKQNNADVFMLPCPESEWLGIPRKPHGIDYYLALDGFSEFCRQRAMESARNIAALVGDDRVSCLCVGIEHSPTCAVSYLYSRRGTIKRKGIFFQYLFEAMTELGIDCQGIGINRRYTGKALSGLRDAILSDADGKDE